MVNEAHIASYDPDIAWENSQRAIDSAVKWAEEHGLKFSVSKTAVLFLTRKQGYKMPPPLKLYGEDIPYTHDCKYLGVTVDDKLSWHRHINDKITSTKRILMAAGSALAHAWGPKPKYMKWLYTSVIRPRITYGAYVWAHAAEKGNLKQKLRSIQRLGLMMIAPIRKGTPTRAIEILYNVEPLHLHIRSLALMTHLRVNPKITWFPRNTTKVGHIMYAINKLPSQLENTSLDKVPYTRDWSNSNNVQIGDGNLNPNDSHRNYQADWTCFTDGSLLEERAGSGAIIYHGNEEFTLGECLKNATVFQSELHAIEMAAIWLLERNPEFCTIQFYIDSQASLRALKSIHNKSKTVAKARAALKCISTLNIVKLTWVEAHKGTEGNELADKAANDARKSDMEAIELPLSLTTAKTIIKLEICREWQNEWENYAEARQSKYFLQGPDKKFATMTQYSRDTISQLIQFITGHAFLKRHDCIIHYGNKDNTGDKECRLCNEEEETPHHIITDCPVLMNLRLDIFHERFLPQYFRAWGIHQMVNYLNAAQIQELLQQ